MGIKLGKMTFGSLFKKPETIQYPAQTKQPPEYLKGHVTNHVESCILCGICEKRCPCNAIRVDKKERIWAINRFSCIQCGYCVRECPKNCLTMDPQYAAPGPVKAEEVFDVPEQEKKPKKEETDTM